MNASSQSEFTLMPGQTHAREMNCGKRGRASGVDRQTGTGPIEQISQSASQARPKIRRESMSIQALVLRIVFRRTDSDENSTSLAGQVLRSMSGILEGMPSLLQEQPMLWIHHLGFGASNLEK